MRTGGRVVVGVVLLAVVFALATAMRDSRQAPVQVAPPAPEVAAVPMAAVPAAEPSRQRRVVAFKLDSDLTRGHYLGERWVSPARFAFAQPGAQYVAHAKLQDIAEDGTRTDLSGDWSTSAPGMIAISHDAAGQVTIVVREAGQGTLTASAGGQRKVLQVVATRTDDAMEVAFEQ